MIIGIGIDTVYVNRFIGKEEMFANKILSPNELNEFYESKHKHKFLAKCWAVKEAAVKALGTGFTAKYNYRSVEYNSPNVVVHASVDETLKFHCSVTDEKDLATAIIIIEK